MLITRTNRCTQGTLSVARLLLLVSCALLSVAIGCNRPETPAQSSGPTKLKVAYIGLTCEAPIFVALEEGFFKDEGLDVELVKTDWDSLRDGLGLGRFDANHTLIMYLLKPIEQGLDVKITAGMHTGCLRVQAGTGTDIKTVEDLKGKTIGVPTMGSPPFLFTSRVLANAGLDPKKDVNWVALAPDVMELSLKNGNVDAVANSEPIGSILLGKEAVRNVADQAVDAPYDDEYCCASVVSGKLLKRNPDAAVKVTRALLKGSKWVGENPSAAAKMSVEKKYISASAEINSLAISKLKYIPGVKKCKDSIDQAAKEMKVAGLLNPSTDPEDLAKRAWIDLDGVTDDWVASVHIEKVPGGGPLRKLSPAAFAAAFDGKPIVASCCSLGKRGATLKEQFAGK